MFTFVYIEYTLLHILNIHCWSYGIHNQYRSDIQMSNGQSNSWFKRKSTVSYCDLKVI